MSVIKETITQDLSSAAVDTSLDYPYDISIVQILLTASTNITETVTISFDSGDGSDFDVDLDVKDLDAESDYVYRPIGMPVIPRSDKLRIQVTNANATGTVRITVLTEARP